MPSSRETIKRNLRQLNDKDPRTPSHDALLKLARLFRVKVDYLLTDHGSSDA
jgi:hypothetical protein